MNSTHRQRIEDLTPERELRYELLCTYVEYYQLLLEIINHLSSEAPLLMSDFPITNSSDTNKMLVLEAARASPSALEDTTPTLGLVRGREFQPQSTGTYELPDLRKVCSSHS